jgi:hypothetical protein
LFLVDWGLGFGVARRPRSSKKAIALGSKFFDLPQNFLAGSATTLFSAHEIHERAKRLPLCRQGRSASGLLVSLLESNLLKIPTA